MKVVFLFAFAICVTACQSLSPGEQRARYEGHALAQATCGRCHAVERLGESPNAGAPPFSGIVNQPGLTRETLSSWLRDAHNYPEEMAFSLDRKNVDALVEYMLTLRDKDYRPPI